MKEQRKKCPVAGTVALVGTTMGMLVSLLVNDAGNAWLYMLAGTVVGFLTGLVADKVRKLPTA